MTTDGLLAYLAKRAQARQEDITTAWDDLLADLRTLLDRPHDRLGLELFIARAIQDAAVAGWVRGQMSAGSVATPPSDSEVLYEVRETARTMPDLYPGLALLTTTDDTQEDS